VNDVEPVVYSTLHKVFAEYFWRRSDYENFYSHSLQYLVYTPESQINATSKVKISLDMAIAILIS